MKPNILLVDDDLSVRESLGNLLLQSGYSVITAADAAEATLCAGPRRFDLVVLDLSLAFKHGWESIRELANLTSEAPLIVMTSRSHKHPSALMSGVSALIEKPLDPNLLLKHVHDLLMSAGHRHCPVCMGAHAHGSAPKLNLVGAFANAQPGL